MSLYEEDENEDDESSDSSKKRGRSRSRSRSRDREKERDRSASPKARAESASKRGRAKAKEEAIELCAEDMELVQKYVDIRRGSKDKRFKWDKLGKNLSRQQCSNIRKYVRQEKLLPEVTYVEGTKFPIFPAETVAAEIYLPEEMWDKGDDEQFEWLDAEYEKGMKENPAKYKAKGEKAYTWHHHHEDGKMQLVEYGTHSRAKHEGGRTTWAKGKR